VTTSEEGRDAGVADAAAAISVVPPTVASPPPAPLDAEAIRRIVAHRRHAVFRCYEGETKRRAGV
jgi:hypothetical protein